jgi:hypothetical protein
MSPSNSQVLNLAVCDLTLASYRLPAVPSPRHHQGHGQLRIGQEVCFLSCLVLSTLSVSDPLSIASLVSRRDWRNSQKTIDNSNSTERTERSILKQLLPVQKIGSESSLLSPDRISSGRWEHPSGVAR